MRHICDRTLGGLLVLGLVALGLRVGLVLLLAQEHRAPLAYEHGEIAENLLAGRGFSVKFLGTTGPTSQQAPLYPAMLAVAYHLGGAGSPQAILAMQLLQCLAGTAAVLAVVWLSWSLVPSQPLVGWITGWGAALYPPHVYMVTHIQVATWATLALVLVMALVLARDTGWPGAAGAGLAAGVLLLFEPILALALPLAALALWQRAVAGGDEAPARGEEGRASKSRRTACLRVALMALVATLVVAPWLVRNRRVHGEWVFVKSTFGYAFWQGNNPFSRGTDKLPKPSAAAMLAEHDGTLAGIDRALWEARHETVYIDDLLLKPTGYREFAGLTEPQRSRLLLERSVEFVRTKPGRYAALCLQRLRYFLLFDETNPKASHPVYRLSTVAWLGLSAAGIVVSRRQWRQIWLPLAVFAVVMAFHTLTITSARFRLPVEPLLFPLAALALVEAGRGLRGAARALGRGI